MCQLYKEYTFFYIHGIREMWEAGMDKGHA